MPDQAIIDGLIATYRELNHRIRGAQLGPNSADVSQVLLQLRDRELNASQAIKQILLGNEAAIDDEGPASSEFEERSVKSPSPTVLLSQFGTAREATLSLVRDLSDEQWNQIYTTPGGQISLRDYLQSLLDRDQKAVQQIDAQMPKVTA